MRRGRVIAGVVVLVLAACIVAGVLWVRSMLSPQRFTAMLRDQVSGAGLQMQLDGPARPTIWPHLAVRLDGLSLRRLGSDEPMLAAQQVQLVVPWGSLLSGETRIETLEINAPRLDLGQARTWLAEYQSRTTSAAQFRLPSIDTGIHLVDGTVINGPTLLLKSMIVDTGKLQSGQPFHLHVQAMNPDNRPLVLKLETTPEQAGDSVRFKPLKLYLGAGAPPGLDLQGQLRWDGGMKLAGTLDGALHLARGDYQASLRFVADSGNAGKGMRVTLDGNGTHLDLALDPAQTWQWWSQISAAQAGPLPLPPVHGTIATDKLDIGSLHIEGLRVESDEPGMAASVAAPARAASAPSAR
ncbi:MAG: hypothetical protein WCD66_11265, partial [Rhodanobacteraceae bacterium]